MDKKTKFFILYNNGNVEIVTEVNETIERMFLNGIITFIFDMNENKIKQNTKEGVREIDVPIV